MKYLIVLVTVLSLTGCSLNSKKYDPESLYDGGEKDSVLASIVTYIFIAPPYTEMKDRFKAQHRRFYTDPLTLSKFSLDKLYRAGDDTYYFLVLRPAAKVGERRAVGGYFKMEEDYKLSGFREVFVTPILAEEEAKKKGAFLFDRMVKGDIKEYLVMKSYVQWPNAASYYDSTKYEWVLDPEKAR